MSGQSSSAEVWAIWQISGQRSGLDVEVESSRSGLPRRGGYSFDGGSFGLIGQPGGCPTASARTAPAPESRARGGYSFSARCCVSASGSRRGVRARRRRGLSRCARVSPRRRARRLAYVVTPRPPLTPLCRGRTTRRRPFPQACVVAFVLIAILETEESLYVAHRDLFEARTADRRRMHLAVTRRYSQTDAPTRHRKYHSDTPIKTPLRALIASHPRFVSRHVASSHVFRPLLSMLPDGSTSIRQNASRGRSRSRAF